jgi:ABC-2 type transport system ATP-binding protein
LADSLVIEATELRKSFDGVAALSGVSLQVPRGSIFGFLGPNGAGKTTTIKVLLGMTRPGAGTASVFGLPASVEQASVEIRRRTGFVSDAKDLYDYMTVGEMISFTASFFATWRPDLEQRYLERFDLPTARKVKALSRGMRTKLALLLALARGAELLILDEPTAALDPIATEEVLQAIVAHVAGEHMTVFFSSHQLSEVEQIADHIAIIHRGRTALSGALDEVRANFKRIQVIFDADAPDATFRSPGVKRVARQGRVLTVLSSAGADGIVDEARSLNPLSIDVTPVTLKDIFIETVGMEN